MVWAGVVAIATGASWAGSQRGIFAAADVSTSAGYGPDPAMLEPRRDHWPLTLDKGQRNAVATLIDRMLPGDPTAEQPTPPASTLNLASFFDEWLSAPYPDQRADRALLLPLLAAVEATPAPNGDAQDQVASERFRVLAAAAYYTTEIGMVAIGYVGNEPRATFEGPPPDVIAGLEAALARLG